MPKERRTLDYLESLDPLYVDNLEWKFYEGGNGIEQIPHGANLKIVKVPEEKYPSIIVKFRISFEEEHTWIKLRLSIYEFAELNDMFKRASFRLERV
jgi:hypothetical protein